MDLAWDGASNYEIVRHATVGETWSVGYEGGTWFTVDIDHEYHMIESKSVLSTTKRFTVTIPQPQTITPALRLTLDEYLEKEQNPHE